MAIEALAPLSMLDLRALLATGWPESGAPAAVALLHNLVQAAVATVAGDKNAVVSSNVVLLFNNCLSLLPIESSDEEETLYLSVRAAPAGAPVPPLGLVRQRPGAAEQSQHGGDPMQIDSGPAAGSVTQDQLRLQLDAILASSAFSSLVKLLVENTLPCASAAAVESMPSTSAPSMPEYATQVRAASHTIPCVFLKPAFCFGFSCSFPMRMMTQVACDP